MVGRDLTIAYNHLNLPHAINNLADEYIILTYTADGEKLTKQAGGVTNNYVAGIEYAGANLEAIYHAEGRCVLISDTFRYEYTLKDHLGNARVHWRAVGNGTAIQALQENHYYPFGMEQEGSWALQVGAENQYKYNGIEFCDDIGINIYYADFRNYDPSICRWQQVDPKFNVFISVYAGFENNGVRFIDPLGDTTYVYSGVNEDGKTMYDNSKLGLIILSAALIDLANGINSSYKIVTKQDIYDRNIKLDKESDLVYEVTNAWKGDGPGFTWDEAFNLGSGYQNGVINPDHPSFIYLARHSKDKDDRILYNAGIALSHEQNTHGYSRIVDFITGNKPSGKDHVEGPSLDQAVVRFYEGPLYKNKFRLTPEYTLSETNKTKATLILQLESIKSSKSYRGKGFVEYVVRRKIGDLNKN